MITAVRPPNGRPRVVPDVPEKGPLSPRPRRGIWSGTLRTADFDGIAQVLGLAAGSSTFKYVSPVPIRRDYALFGVLPAPRRNSVGAAAVWPKTIVSLLRKAYEGPADRRGVVFFVERITFLNKLVLKLESSAEFQVRVVLGYLF